MKLYYYRSTAPNFGDDLNNVLMPMVFPGFFDEDDLTLFLAIGSVLFDHHPPSALKVVFGSGYGQYTAAPRLDDRWKVYCVRGPLTAEALGLDARLVAADAAVLVNRHMMKAVPKRFSFSYIPHWQSLRRGDWPKACQLANIEFIDPRWPVERIIEMIQASTTVITEAMHGAIVADALRVPWVPVLPFHRSHRFKWSDWAAALKIDLKHHHAFPATLQDFWVSYTGRDGNWMSSENRLVQLVVNAANVALPYIAAHRLERLSRMEPVLSSDVALEAAVSKLEEAADRIRRDFRR
jgi:Polysaccharide pyruvyl transferase